jgi:hypothetical protein
LKPGGIARDFFGGIFVNPLDGFRNLPRTDFTIFWHSNAKIGSKDEIF